MQLSAIIFRAYNDGAYFLRRPDKQLILTFLSGKMIYENILYMFFFFKWKCFISISGLMTILKK
jgi:hypothetical protein